MKIISTFFLLILFCFPASSQLFKLTSNYALGMPQKEMGSNIKALSSLQLGLLYQLPKIKQISVGAEVTFGSYANQRIDQTFQFDDNTSSLIPVNYSSNAFMANLQGRLDLFSKKHFVMPYINIKGGLANFFSNIHVDDPNDGNSCHPLEKEKIINDNTLYWSAGGGLQFDLTHFYKKKHENRLLIDFAVNTIQGGNLDYINTRDLMDAQSMNDPDGKPLNVPFVNASTQSIHEHTVAQVYTSRLNMLEFRLGIILNFKDPE